MDGRRPGRRAPLFLICVVGAFLGGSAPGWAASRFDPPLRLDPEVGVVEVSRSLWFLEDASDGHTLDEVLSQADAFEPNRASVFNPGTASGIIWLAFDVQSAARRRRSFVVSLDRGTVETASVHLVRDDQAELLLADTEEDRAEALRRFGTLAAAFPLEPGERASVLVGFRGANWSAIRMTAATAEAFEADRRAGIAIFLVVLGAVGTLVLYGSIAFVLMGRQIVLLYATAQIALFVFYAHMMGYTAAYLWPESPKSGLLVAPVSFAVFLVAMAQFGRVFFETRARARRMDRALAVCVAAGGLALVVLLLEPFVPALDRRIAIRMLYAIAVVCWSVLPALAVHASLRWSRDFWPMAVAWGVVALFMISMVAVFLGAFPTLPRREGAYHVMIVAEASLLALAIALRVRSLREEALDAQRRLAESLRSQLAASERARRLSGERSWALQDLVEKGRLLVAAGHDSRQMLSALRHYAAGLRRRASPEDVAEASRGIDEVVESLDEVLRAMVAGSGSGGIGDDTLALDTLPASSLLDSLARIHGRAASAKGIDMRVHPSARMLATDRSLAMRVLGNLVSNAIKYTDEGGRVLVGLRPRGGGCVFQVWDTGCGIDPAALALLLDPSVGDVRVDDREEGSGSGLGIAKAATARLGGWLAARSEPARGSVFELWLPHARSTEATGEGGRILLLADRGGREGPEAPALRGVQVEIARTLAEARRRMAAAGSYDLVLVDQHFDGVDAGLALARELAGGAAAQPVALLSYDRSGEARARLGRGARLVLYKPLSALALAAALRCFAASPRPQRGAAP